MHFCARYKLETYLQELGIVTCPGNVESGSVPQSPANREDSASPEKLICENSMSENQKLCCKAVPESLPLQPAQQAADCFSDMKVDMPFLKSFVVI